MTSVLENAKAKKTSRPWNILEFSTIRYNEALKIQENLWKRAIQTGEHFLMLLEHFPVVTMGRRTKSEDILVSKDDFKAQGIDLVKINRGGSATYHGPGQLVGYLICKPSRFGGIYRLVNQVLEAIAATISSYGIDVKIDVDNPGVWTNSLPPKKLSAVGMSTSLGYTMHGFAINVDMQLTGFHTIIPCGLDLPVTTINQQINKPISMEKLKEARKVIEERFELKRQAEQLEYDRKQTVEPVFGIIRTASEITWCFATRYFAFIQGDHEDHYVAHNIMILMWSS